MKTSENNLLCKTRDSDLVPKLDAVELVGVLQQLGPKHGYC